MLRGHEGLQERMKDRKGHLDLILATSYRADALVTEGFG